MLLRHLNVRTGSLNLPEKVDGRRHATFHVQNHDASLPYRYANGVQQFQPGSLLEFWSSNGGLEFSDTREKS